jgi:hypothetical protein
MGQTVAPFAPPLLKYVSGQIELEKLRLHLAGSRKMPP